MNGGQPVSFAVIKFGERRKSVPNTIGLLAETLRECVLDLLAPPFSEVKHPIRIGLFRDKQQLWSGLVVVLLTDNTVEAHTVGFRAVTLPPLREQVVQSLRLGLAHGPPPVRYCEVPLWDKFVTDDPRSAPIFLVFSHVRQELRTGFSTLAVAQRFPIVARRQPLREHIGIAEPVIGLAAPGSLPTSAESVGCLSQTHTAWAPTCTSRLSADHTLSVRSRSTAARRIGASHRDLRHHDPAVTLEADGVDGAGVGGGAGVVGGDVLVAYGDGAVPVAEGHVVGAAGGEVFLTDQP